MTPYEGSAPTVEDADGREVGCRPRSVPLGSSAMTGRLLVLPPPRS
jgi:hypothetical protein